MLARLWASALIALPLGLGAVACSGADAAADGPTDGTNDQVIAPAPATTTNEDDDDPAPAPAAPDAAAPAPELEVHALANLGDSISQAFDADDSSPIDVGLLKRDPGLMFHDNPALSWIQGTDPRIGSVRQHFAAKDPNLVMTPFSRSGAELVRDFENQAKAIAKAGAKPDLVYVLLGGNDVCNREKSTTADATAPLYSVDRWREAAVKGLTALVDALPEGATVRVLSMPRVDLLFDTLQSTRVPIRYESPIGPISATTTCKDLWSLTAQYANGICKIVTTETSAAKRKAIGDRVDAYNDALAEEVRRFAADATLNPKRIRLQSDWHGSLDEGNAPNSSVGTYKFAPAEVSKLDCFHPSIKGQQNLSDHALDKARWE
ncbi:MAG: hypothetical protein KIT84_42115 [Labilithrix sp.]|nr:hypothetical protein [Labilithrix sp.]MCW5817671.1 hypothetical protein [Labilithrix sp.]